MSFAALTAARLESCAVLLKLRLKLNCFTLETPSWVSSPADPVMGQLNSVRSQQIALLGAEKVFAKGIRKSALLGAEKFLPKGA